MMLLLHICIAITGILQTSYMLFVPSKNGLHASYALLAMTLASGTALVISSGTHILQSCMMGLLYTSFVTFGIVRARRALDQNTTL